MALEDVARLLSPKTPQNAVRLLECFRGGEPKTKEDLVRESGLSESMVEFYLTRMRRWYMLTARRERGGRTLYELNPEAFHARIDTLLVDPVRNLVRR